MGLGQSKEVKNTLSIMKNSYKEWRLILKIAVLKIKKIIIKPFKNCKQKEMAQNNIGRQ